MSKVYVLYGSNDDNPFDLIEVAKVYKSKKDAQAEMRKQYNDACSEYIEQDKEDGNFDTTMETLEKEYHFRIDDDSAFCPSCKIDTLNEWWRIKETDLE